MTAVVEKRIALVGLGAAARDWREAVTQLPELVLVAGVDSDRAACAAFAAQGVTAFATLGELLAVAGPPELAIVCTPPSVRLELAEPLLRAGIDLLLEPPLATSPDEADRIAALAERQDRVAMTVSRMRASAALRSAAAQIAAGAIGRLCAVELALGRKRAAGSGWRADPAVSGGGVWMDLGPDALDAAELLAGPIQRIRALEFLRVQGAELEDEARVETEHAAGLRCHIHVSWNESLERPIARCIGDRGELSFGWAQTVVQREDGSRQVLAGARDLHAERVSALESLLRERRRRERSVDAGAQTLAWLHAAYRSLSTRRSELA
jgi:predicted dehydrogenase